MGGKIEFMAEFLKDFQVARALMSKDEVGLDYFGTDLGSNVPHAARIARRVNGAPRRVALGMKDRLFPLMGSAEDASGYGDAKGRLALTLTKEV